MAALALFMACATTPTAKVTAVEPHPQSPGPRPIPADLAGNVERAESLGGELYRLDKASAIGTDVLLAQVPPAGLRGLAGWVTFREGDAQGHPIDSYAVMFVTAESPPRMAFTIHVPLQGPARLETFSPPKEALPGVALLHHARQTALAAVPHGRRNLNPVILPGEALGQPGKIIVYVLAAEQTVGEMVFGIHYRVRVSGDGSTVEDVHPLSQSELVVGPPSAAGVPPGAKDIAAFVTHHLDDTPNETHVFVSLLHASTPVMVATERGLWGVKGAKISFYGTLQPSGAAP